jgi:hypothetical protein
LYDHWESVEWLAQLSRETPIFETEHILAVMVRLAPSRSVDEQQQALRHLVNADILQAQPRGKSYQLNTYVLEFVRGLTREHELGLSEVLGSRINAITDATRKLNEAVHGRDMDWFCRISEHRRAGRVNCGAESRTNRHAQLQRDALSDRCDPGLHPLVCSLPAELPAHRGDHGRARRVGRPFVD